MALADLYSGPLYLGGNPDGDAADYFRKAGTLKPPTVLGRPAPSPVNAEAPNMPTPNLGSATMLGGQQSTQIRNPLQDQAPQPLTGKRKALAAIFAGMGAFKSPELGQQIYNEEFVAPQERYQKQEEQQQADIAKQREAASRESLQGAQAKEALARANALNNPAKDVKQDWRPVTGTNWEINSATGETRQMQGVPAPEQKEQPFNIAAELHKEHPDWTPEQIQEAMARPSFPRIMPVTDAKGNTLGYNYFQGTPGGGVKTQFIPAGAGGAPTQGGVIPAKPGTSLVDQGYMAEGLQEMIQKNIFPAIDEASKAGQMGPISGRVQDFLLKRVGDPSSPAAYLQATLDAVPMMLGRIYGYRSAEYAQEYNRFLSTRMTPSALKAYLNGVQAHAGTIQSLTGPPQTKAGQGSAAQGGKKRSDGIDFRPH